MAGMSSNPFISLQGVRKVYRSGGAEFLAVSDVTMDVQEGELVSLVGALDALTREQMNLEMLRIWRESGKTIIFITHSIQEAVFLSSHCAVLTAGPAKMADYFPIDLPLPRDLPLKTTDAFGAYARRIYEKLGLGAA